MAYYIDKLPRLFSIILITLSVTTTVAVRAQSACQLVPVPLADRVRQAPLVVEASVGRQQVERLPSGAHLVTRSQLEVYKVFKGQLPAGPLSVLTQGGALGLELETATNTLHLSPGEQGVFLLEPDPAAPGEWRAYAGPQGLLQYNLADLSASDPFARYPALGPDVQARVAALAGAAPRELRANQPLQLAARPATRRLTAGTSPVGPLAGPSITDFSPSSLVAGANDNSSLLTITGSGFGSSKGNVQFRNADNPGPDTSPNYTQVLANDVLSWSDTQVQVRVPSASASQNAAGTGLVRVLDAAGNVATSASALTVTYALTNVVYNDQTYRVRLIGTNGNGGYTLAYSTSFPAEAQAPFATALQSWHCATSMNRLLAAGTTTVNTVSSSDGVNVVRFAGDSELPAGVLGVTNVSYAGCNNGGNLDWVLTSTDYSFAPVPYTGYTWNFTTDAPTNSQFDFQSVALHELGHGEQLTHIIAPAGVMHYAIANGQAKRTLDGNLDIAGGNNVISYSTGPAAAQQCVAGPFVASNGGCTLPVELVAFAARYAAGTGTTLAWTTASEQQAAYFAVESQDAAAADWQEVSRQPAAGGRPGLQQYAARDARPLAGARYYRLRQADLDGTSHYSPVVAVQYTPGTLAAYPNPATSLAHLSGPLAAGAAARVRVLDALGRCVRQAAGPAGQASFDLPLQGLAAGWYVLEWQGGAEPSRLRLAVE